MVFLIWALCIAYLIGGLHATAVNFTVKTWLSVAVAPIILFWAGVETFYDWYKKP